MKAADGQQSSRARSDITPADFDATPSIIPRNATHDMPEINPSVGTAMQDCPPLPNAQQQDQNSSQTVSDGLCSSRASRLLPTTLTSDVWGRLPASTKELMQESLSWMDSELGMSYMQQHPLEAGPGPAAEGAPHATAQYKLNAMSAADIFLRKRAAPEDPNLSSRLAAEYSVTTKAVRDVWNQRTWRSITQFL